jgi:hypothetical protein
MKIWEWRLLGVLALGGSAAGLVIGLSVLGAPNPLLPRLLMLPFLGMYVWGIWCGMRMLERDPRALLPNAWFWAMQTPYLTSPVFGYLFASGSLFYVTYAPGSGFGFRLQLGSAFQYSFLEADKPFAIGVNVFAVAVLVLLVNRHHQLLHAPAPAVAAPEGSGA